MAKGARSALVSGAMSSADSRRIAFTVQYDGAAFHGWQLQPEDVTVQGELERIFSRLFDRPARVIGSGRTDRGVHAIGQVAAVDAPARWDAGRLRRAANALLPPTIRIAHAEEVAERFHPRFDARERSYIYRVGTSEEAASPFHYRWCWPYLRPLDCHTLNGLGAEIVGDHSFRAFAKAGQEERGDRCIVTRVEWARWDDLGLELHISANRFLHHMVRYLVGTMVDIAGGNRPSGDLPRLLEGEAGMLTSPPAPPEGLFLSRVRYDPGAYNDPRSGVTLTRGF